MTEWTSANLLAPVILFAEVSNFFLNDGLRIFDCRLTADRLQVIVINSWHFLLLKHSNEQSRSDNRFELIEH